MNQPSRKAMAGKLQIYADKEAPSALSGKSEGRCIPRFSSDGCRRSGQADRFSAEQKSWVGCSLNDLIEFVGISGQAHYIEFICSEPAAGAFSIPIGELESQEIGLVWERNGQSLSAEEGGPLLVLVPGLEGYQPLPGVFRINLVIVPCSTNRRDWGPALAA